MLTIFTTAKPFLGHVATIQRNALQPWKALHPDIEIILFGADDGAAAVAQEFTLRHEPHVERNQHDTKRLDYMFTHAQSIARHDLLCYINCDIILMDDFIPAVERVRAAHREFLMVGRRWDADIAAPLHFSPERRSPDRRVEVSTTPASQSGGYHSPDRRSPDWQESLR